MAFAKLSLCVLGELIDNDIDILAKRIIIMHTTSHLGDTLWGNIYKHINIII